MLESLSFLPDFRFLRPLWLLALSALPLLWVILKRSNRQESSWRKAIDPDLLPYLLESNADTKTSSGAHWVLIAGLLAIVALAGPAWNKVPQPVHRAENAIVLAFDLSLSMNVEDVKPSRLIKARHKLLDMLDHHAGGQAALIAYAGDAHVVSPLTDDTSTIKNLIPALSPVIMPAMGSDPVAAIALGLKLLRDGGVNRGKILLLSDGLEFAQIEPIVDMVSTSPHQLAVLGVGTEEGGPIPLPEQGFLKQRGEIVIARAGIKSLETLATLSDGRFSHLQLDDSDIEYLLQPDHFTIAAESREIDRDFDQWREEGPWLLLALAFIAAFGFRRGLVFSVSLVMITLPQQSLAFTWQDLWRTQDQQAAQAFASEQHAEAALQFRAKDWKAAAYFRHGDFAAAADLYREDPSIAGQYNFGNALAKAGKLDEAIAAYNNVLKQNPQHEDAAFNKALLEQLKRQQQTQENSGDNQNTDDSNQQPNGSERSGQNSDKPSDSQDSQESDQGQEREPAHGQESKQEQDTQAPHSEQGQPEAQGDPGASDQGKENKQPQRGDTASSDTQQGQQQQAAALAESDLNDEEIQAMEQWLRRIPDDPGGLLRRKFDHEYRQRQLDQQFMPRSEGDPIW